MAKLQLGKAPTSFKRIVKIPCVSGETADIEMTFKYRTRKQFAELLDKIIAKAPSETQSEDADIPAKSIADRLAESDKDSVDYILDIAEAWDLADDFNKKNVAALIDEFPGAAAIIGEKYRIALWEGAIKN